MSGVFPRIFTVVAFVSSVFNATPASGQMATAPSAAGYKQEAGMVSSTMPKALQAIADYDGAGVAVFIRDSNPAWLSERYGQPELNQTANVLRDYGVGAQILIDLGVRDMLLLTSSKTVLPGSTGYGLQILGRVPLA